MLNNVLNNNIRCSFLILEKDLEGRYPLVTKYFNKLTHTLAVKAQTRQNLLLTILSRHKQRKDLFRAYCTLPNYITCSDILFVSNTEGYVSKNILSWLKTDFPDLKIVVLQHGLFHLEEKNLKLSLISLLNRVTKLFLNFYYFGTGFSSSFAEFYVVYNNDYSTMLTKYGINKDKVFVSSSILKGDNFLKISKSKSIKNNIIFLLQPLASLGIVSYEDESLLVKKVINFLAEKFDNVLIKQHPYDQIKIDGLPKNTQFVDGSIAELSKLGGSAISFYSEALNEMRYRGLKTFAVFSKKIKAKKHFYNHFEEVISFDKYDYPITLKKRMDLSCYYETQLNSINEILDEIYK